MKAECFSLNLLHIFEHTFRFFSLFYGYEEF